MSGIIADSPATTPPPADPGRRFLVINVVCRLTLAAVFLMAAVTKITAMNVFAAEVARQAHLPTFLEWLVSRTLPWLELTCGLCLALGYARREAAVIVAVLLGLFLVHGWINWGEPCGCFLFPPLESNPPVWWPTLRNGLLLVCAGFASEVWPVRRRQSSAAPR